jgi:hypothetical protein
MTKPGLHHPILTHGLAHRSHHPRMAVIVWIVGANSQILARPGEGLAFSVLKIVFYVVGVASIALAYYFNHQFVAQYAVDGGNPIGGRAVGNSSSRSATPTPPLPQPARTTPSSM